MLIYQTTIERNDVKRNTNTIYLFGDYMDATGEGSQATRFRQLPNTLFLPVKRTALRRPEASIYDSDSDMDLIRATIDKRFKKLEKYIVHDCMTCVVPYAGVTSWARLQDTAPILCKDIDKRIKDFRAQFIIGIT